MIETYRKYKEETGDATAAAILVLAEAITNRPTDDALLTAKQAAQILGVSVDKVYDLSREGHLKHKKIGRLTRFDREDIKTFQRQSEEPAGPRLSCLKRV